MIYKPCNVCGKKVQISKLLASMKKIKVFCSKECGEQYSIECRSEVKRIADSENR